MKEEKNLPAEEATFLGTSQMQAILALEPSVPIQQSRQAAHGIPQPRNRTSSFLRSGGHLRHAHLNEVRRDIDTKDATALVRRLLANAAPLREPQRALNLLEQVHRHLQDHLDLEVGKGMKGGAANAQIAPDRLTAPEVRLGEVDVFVYGGVEREVELQES